MSSSVKIALVQQHATRDVDENIKRGVSNFEEAAENGADIIAFAELAFLPFFPQKPAGENENVDSYAEEVPGPVTQRFSSLAEEHGAVAVLNLYERKGNKTFDSSPVIDSDGEILGVTRMVHIMEGPGFHEQDYYTPAEDTSFVYRTEVADIGVAICYDRHYPEYMRNLGVSGAEIVFVPQAGVFGEWGEGMYESELRVPSFQNGYYSALVNRVGKEEVNHFSGGSFVVDPHGKVIDQASEKEDEILYAKLDPKETKEAHASKHFLPDRRPDFYSKFEN